MPVHGESVQCSTPWGVITFSPPLWNEEARNAYNAYNTYGVNNSQNADNDQEPSWMHPPDMTKEITTEEGPGYKRTITTFRDHAGRVTVITETNRDGRITTERKTYEERPQGWAEWAYGITKNFFDEFLYW
ncbi:hypothetical protein PSACC_00456 [Paramicrosporidium saccamoebae]|uniref:Uncharacterized protein n=1 Tax=Paramicrosporidium saccamoebae TaxID=1246581 RepID=A0A2H9TPR3_9FUNG|nr:hypothetical protein PSACC_00456 [Paramicrosporidium saccamoebae]